MYASKLPVPQYRPSSRRHGPQVDGTPIRGIRRSTAGLHGRRPATRARGARVIARLCVLAMPSLSVPVYPPHEHTLPGSTHLLVGRDVEVPEGRCCRMIVRPGSRSPGTPSAIACLSIAIATRRTVMSWRRVGVGIGPWPEVEGEVEPPSDDLLDGDTVDPLTDSIERVDPWRSRSRRCGALDHGFLVRVQAVIDAVELGPPQ
jgi:hypothetical protein